jgi:poly(A) polymerase
VSGRGKLAADMREIWVMQPRFDKRTGSTPFGMVLQARFRAGFDFLRLRADVGEIEEDLAEWWQEFQAADDARREDLVAQVREEQRQKQKAAQPAARRAPRKAEDVQEASPLDTIVSEGDAPAKKRRRRRRKPAGGADMASSGGSAE